MWAETKCHWSRSLSKDRFGRYYSVKQDLRPLRLGGIAGVLDMTKFRIWELVNPVVSDFSNSIKEAHF